MHSPPHNGGGGETYITIELHCNLSIVLEFIDSVFNLLKSALANVIMVADDQTQLDWVMVQRAPRTVTFSGGLWVFDDGGPHNCKGQREWFQGHIHRLEGVAGVEVKIVVEYGKDKWCR